MSSKGKPIPVQDSEALESVFTIPEQAELDSLLPAEPVATITAKVKALDALLNLAVKDCKFSVFVHELLMALMNAIRCEAGSILEINQENQTVFFRATVGQSSSHLSDVSIPVGKGVVGHVIESRQTMVIDDLTTNAEHLSALPQVIGFQARNMVAIPLIVRREVYGVVELLNREGEERFTTADLEVLNYLAQMCSKAIEIRLMLNWAKQSRGENG